MSNKDMIMPDRLFDVLLQSAVDYLNGVQDDQIDEDRMVRAVLEEAHEERSQ